MKDALDYETDPYRRGAILSGQMDAKQMSPLLLESLKQELLKAGIDIYLSGNRCDCIYWRNVVDELEKRRKG